MRDNNTGNDQAKKHFIIKLIPPRPTFAQDMTEEERKIMGEHSIYWRDMAARGIALVYGPVLDSGGAYGLGIIEAETENQALSLAEGDPAVKMGLVKVEISQMMAILGKKML